MSAFNLLHLVTKSQPVALRACGLPSGSCRDKKNCKVVFSQQELRKRLTPLQYHVTQEKGTESAFEGEYTHHKDPGIYKCVVCGTPLFKSETKFDSGSGWPSFYDVIISEAITLTDDFSYGMHRVETSCSQDGIVDPMVPGLDSSLGVISHVTRETFTSGCHVPRRGEEYDF
ncbi:methionine-R-sulfoxide reductase B3 isoform X3 [Tamandua tetradactyla]|uniref:methionine-R-sulfoxide reductase B3 isoform X3 n=1 Tax=Tamandua tetradactyla TaxID=48850 RepID=UPI004053A53E